MRGASTARAGDGTRRPLRAPALALMGTTAICLGVWWIYQNAYGLIAAKPAGVPAISSAADPASLQPASAAIDTPTAATPLAHTQSLTEAVPQRFVSELTDNQLPISDLPTSESTLAPQQWGATAASALTSAPTSAPVTPDHATPETLLTSIAETPTPTLAMAANPVIEISTAVNAEPASLSPGPEAAVTPLSQPEERAPQSNLGDETSGNGGVPSPAEIRRLRADVIYLADHGQTDAARTQLQQLLTLLGPASSFGKKLRAYVETRAGNNDAAYQAYHELLAQDRTDADALFNAALLAIKLGRYEDASHLLREVAPQPEYSDKARRLQAVVEGYLRQTQAAGDQQ